MINLCNHTGGTLEPSHQFCTVRYGAPNKSANALIVMPAARRASSIALSMTTAPPLLERDDDVGEKYAADETDRPVSETGIVVDQPRHYQPRRQHYHFDVHISMMNSSRLKGAVWIAKCRPTRGCCLFQPSPEPPKTGKDQICQTEFVVEPAEQRPPRYQPFNQFGQAAEPIHHL